MKAPRRPPVLPRLSPPPPPAIPHLHPPQQVAAKHYRAERDSFSVHLSRTVQGATATAKITIKRAWNLRDYRVSAEPGGPERDVNCRSQAAAKGMAKAAVRALEADGWLVSAVASYHADPKYAADSTPCCERGTKTYCVCVRSWQCPEHGKTCYGSHD